MRAEWNVTTPRLYDEATGETVRAFAVMDYKEDFAGYQDVVGGVWQFGNTAGGSCAMVDPALELGVVRATLTSTSEAQTAYLDFADKLQWCIGHGLNFEARVRLHAIPSVAAVNAEIGLCSEFNADPDAVVTSAWFRVDGSGVVTVETDDGTHETTKVATGVTLTTDLWTVFRADCSDTADVKFYVNGTEVAPATTFNIAAAVSVLVQPVARIAKASGTGVGTLDVDYIYLWQSERSA